MAGKYQKSRIASSRKRETKDSATPSATPEPVAKRAKIDKSTPSKKADAKRIKIEQLTPSKKASTSVVHPSPSAARKAWIKDGQVDLDEPAQDLEANYLKYIHPEALSLFKQVEDQTDFRIATIVFWSTYFAYQRGLPPALRLALLKRVCETSKNDWHKDAMYRKVWDDEHDTIVNYIHERIDHYCQLWLESPAGTHFLPLINNMKVSKKGKPELLSASDIVEFQHRDAVGSDLVSRKGIEWTVQEVMDIFKFLQPMSELQETGLLSDSGDNIEWFQADISALREDPKGPNTWYARFSAVATSMVANYIALYHGYQLKKYRFSPQTCKDVLMRIPTPMVNDRVDPFPIISGVTLSTWRTDMVLEENSNIEDEDSRKMVESIDSGTMDPDPATMDKALARGNSVEEDIHDHLEQGMKDAGVDMDDFDGLDFANPAIFGRAPTYARSWTPFLQMLAGANQLTRAALISDSLKCQRTRLLRIADDCQYRVSAIDQEIQTLEQEISSYKAGREATLERLAEMDTKRLQLADLQHQRSQQEEDPFETSRREKLAREAQRQQQAQRSRPTYGYTGELSAASGFSTSPVIDSYRASPVMNRGSPQFLSTGEFRTESPHPQLSMTPQPQSQYGQPPFPYPMQTAPYTHPSQTSQYHPSQTSQYYLQNQHYGPPTHPQYPYPLRDQAFYPPPGQMPYPQHHLEPNVVQGTTPPSRDAAQPSRDAAQPFRDAAQPSRDTAQPSRDTAPLSRDAAQPSRDAAQVLTSLRDDQHALSEPENKSQLQIPGTPEAQASEAQTPEAQTPEAEKHVGSDPAGEQNDPLAGFDQQLEQMEAFRPTPGTKRLSFPVVNTTQEQKDDTSKMDLCD